MIKINRIDLDIKDTENTQEYSIWWDSETQKWTISTNSPITFYPRVIKALTEIYEIVREINRDNAWEKNKNAPSK